MRVEEMALRSEIRQMLNEAGFNKNTLKDLVKEVLQEELNKAIKQAVAESNCDIVGYTKKNIDSIINKTTERVVKEKISDAVVGNYFKRMKVDVSINPIMSYKENTENKDNFNEDACEFCKHKLEPNNTEPCVNCSHNFIDKFERQ